MQFGGPCTPIAGGRIFEISANFFGTVDIGASGPLQPFVHVACCKSAFPEADSRRPCSEVWAA